MQTAGDDLVLTDDPELGATLDEELTRRKVPGVAVGVLHAGRAISVTRGVTNVDHPLPVDDDTLFLIGSTTKTMTATVLMSLIDEGRLRLDDRVVDHLPDLRLADEHVRDVVTVGQLLNHTAGWQGDAESDTGWGDDALARSIAETVAHLPQLSEPGQLVSYSNSAFMLAGRLAEVLTGRSYESAVHHHVFEPLGMTASYFFPWDVAARRVAIGHRIDGDTVTPFPSWPLTRGMHPAGGVLSSMRDQLRYAQYHLDGSALHRAPLHDGTRLLMQRPTASLNSVLTGVGVSWLLEQRGDISLVTHSGNISNISVSSMVLAPDHDFAIVVHANSRIGMGLAATITDWAFEHYLGLAARPRLEAQPLTDALADAYIGRYDSGQWSLDVTRANGTLSVQMVLAQVPDDVQDLMTMPPVDVVVVGEDQLAPARAPFETIGDFVRGADGSVTHLRWGLRLSPKVSAR